MGLLAILYSMELEVVAEGTWGCGRRNLGVWRCGCEECGGVAEGKWGVGMGKG